MVKITNGIKTLTVTRGAFNGIYKSQGYVEIDPNPEVLGATSPSATAVADNDDENIDGDVEVADAGMATATMSADDAKFVAEANERPLSQWSKNDVKRYANIMDIDISGTRNVGEAKSIIKAYIDA